MVFNTIYGLQKMSCKEMDGQAVRRQILLAYAVEECENILFPLSGLQPGVPGSTSQELGVKSERNLIEPSASQVAFCLWVGMKVSLCCCTGV